MGIRMFGADCFHGAERLNKVSQCAELYDQNFLLNRGFHFTHFCCWRLLRKGSFAFFAEREFCRISAYTPKVFSTMISLVKFSAICAIDRVAKIAR